MEKLSFDERMELKKLLNLKCISEQIVEMDERKFDYPLYFKGYHAANISREAKREVRV